MDKKNVQPTDGSCVPTSMDVRVYQNYQEAGTNRINYATQPYNAMVSPYSQLYLNASCTDFRSPNVVVPTNSTPYSSIPPRFDLAKVAQPYMSSNMPVPCYDHFGTQGYYYPRQMYGFPQQPQVKRERDTDNQIQHIPCVEVKKENPLLTGGNESMCPTARFPFKFTGERMTVEQRDMKMQANNCRMGFMRQLDGCETVISLLNQLNSIPYFKSSLADKGVDTEHFIDRVIATQNHKLYNQRTRNNEKSASIQAEELKQLLKSDNTLDICQEMQLKIAYLSAEEMLQYSELFDCDTYHRLKMLKRRLKNRHAARGCRRRKSDEHSELQNRVSIIKIIYNALRSIRQEFIDDGNALCKKIKEKDSNVTLNFNHKRSLENIENEKRDFHRNQMKDTNFELNSNNKQFMNESDFSMHCQHQGAALSASITPVSRVQPNVGAASVCTSKATVYEYHSNNARRRLFSEDSKEPDKLKAHELQLFQNYNEDYDNKCEEVGFNDGIPKGHAVRPSIKKLLLNSGDNDYSVASSKLSYENYYTPYPSNYFSNDDSIQFDKSRRIVARDLVNCNDMDLQNMMNQMNLENPIAKNVFRNMNPNLINLTPQQSLELSSNNSAQKMESPVMNEAMNRMHLAMKNEYNPGMMMSNIALSGPLHQTNIDAFTK